MGLKGISIMYRTLVFAKLVSQVFSQHCVYNEASEDFTIRVGDNEFTLSINEETGEATTTKPWTSRPTTTTKKYEYTTTKKYDVTIEDQDDLIDDNKEDGYAYDEEPSEIQAAIIAKLDMWKNRQKKPCKSFTEVVGKQKSKWTVCPFGGLGEVIITDL